MKRAMKYMLMYVMLTIAFGSFSSCVKAWEDEREEIIRRPQVEIIPESPDWEDTGTEIIE